MMLLEKLYPDMRKKSIYDVDYKGFYNRGYRAILFDIDNTLTTHGTRADESNIEFFKNLRALGFKTCLISNNKEKRVSHFAEAVSSPYVFKADKPSQKGYLNALKILKVKKEQTLFVGDQIFTDIWGANNAGIYSVLVEPINPREEIQIVLKRYLERIVLFFYEKKSAKKSRTFS